MRYRLLILTLFLSCRSSHPQLPPSVMVERTDTALHNISAFWYVRGKKFSGYIIEKDSGIIVSKLPIIEGKENGKASGLYRNGAKKFERYYVNGDREGRHKGWYSNGVTSFIYFFHEDKYEGEQKTFYKSGHLWQSLHYVHGYEEGKQKSWSDSGRVINNFTVKNGKLYGVIGRYDCVSVMQ